MNSTIYTVTVRQKQSTLGIIVSHSCVHRVTIGRLRVCVGSILAFYQSRDENRAKIKISFSCDHRVV